MNIGNPSQGPSSSSSAPESSGEARKCSPAASDARGDGQPTESVKDCLTDNERDVKESPLDNGSPLAEASPSAVLVPADNQVAGVSKQVIPEPGAFVANDNDASEQGPNQLVEQSEDQENGEQTAPRTSARLNKKGAKQA